MIMKEKRQQKKSKKQTHDERQFSNAHTGQDTLW